MTSSFEGYCGDRWRWSYSVEALSNEEKYYLRSYSRMRCAESAGDRTDAVLAPFIAYESNWNDCITVDVRRIFLGSWPSE